VIIKLGTRKSKLALWQAEWVKEKLQVAGCVVEIYLIDTQGDQLLDVNISKIGSKGVFTEELEMKLESGEIDIAVHSAKDLQSKLPEGFEIIAYSVREKINDVIISDGEIDLQNPNLILGTSSTRRVATFKKNFPSIQVVDMRGNLQTRIEKMRKGVCHGLVLAFAGIHRMNYDHMIRHVLDENIFIPAVGQGSIAVEAHRSIEKQKLKVVRNAINDLQTEGQLIAERSYLAKMNGGCSIPIFASCKNIQSNELVIAGGIVSLDGKKEIVKKVKGINPVALGEELALQVSNAGGLEILAEIRNKLNKN